MTVLSDARVSTMHVEPIRPGFVAEVSGVDLTRELSPAEQGDLRRALDAYSVLMFRHQPVTDDDQLRLAGYLGRLRTVKGRPYIGTAGNVDDEGNIIAADDVRQWVAKGSRVWHTDISYKRLPDLYALLSSRVVPSAGGNTEFADTRAAWDALDAEDRELCEDLIGIHDFTFHRGLIGYECSEQEKLANPPTPQPLVLHDARTGRRGLYMASHLASIQGWDFERSRELIERLIAHATQPRFTFEMEWGGAGSLVIWDERFTMHRGRPYDDQADQRVLRRCAVVTPGAI